MAQYQYAFQKDAANTARAVGRSIPISSKNSVEICSLIRYKPVARARAILEDAIAMNQPLSFKRYVNGLGHKAGMGPGRYLPTTARTILAVIDSAVKNAEVKNLGTDLIIIHACAHRASRARHYGRQSGQKEKRTHLEIVLAPRPTAKSQKQEKKADKISKTAKEHKASPAKSN